MHRFLGVIVKLLNHFITSSVFFYWFNLVPIIVLLFIVSSLVLVNLLEIGATFFTKTKLDTINKVTIIGTKLNQLKNRDNVQNWFNNLTQTPKTGFIKFYITKFYTTITKKHIN